ncbi:hypothetical protein ACFQGE_07470 [Halomicroarcula sp. GCM10025817]|uniref:hypothetical protein n=1 Tax=Haloarcula TaxID=2237 RepID=UPI0023E7A951|nr:hypothetical protein [Halomicroarcula sp. SYNS111]
MGWENSKLHNHWKQAVKKGNANDFVICITASSKTGVSGTGKTTLTTDLAQSTDLTEDGFDATQKASLDAGEIAYERVPEIEPHSAIVWDEAQGAPGTVGLDARRAMKQEAIDSVSSILANRDKQFTIIITAQIFSMLDPRIYPLIDAWLLIRKGPDHPNGPVGTYHKVFVEDYNLGNPKVKTPAVEDFAWNQVPHDDPDYQELERLKQMAKTQNYGDDPEEEDGEDATPDISIDQRNALLKQRIKDDDVTESDLAATFGISRQRVNQIVND